MASNPWLSKLLANPMVTDLLAGKLPEPLQHSIADVRLALEDFRPELLVEGPLSGDEHVNAVGIFLGALEDAAEIRGVNLFRGRIDGGKIRTGNIILAEVHGGQLTGFNALIGSVHGGELSRANLIHGEIHGGQVRGVNMIVGDVHGGDVQCNILIGDVHGGVVTTKRHLGAVHGGDLQVKAKGSEAPPPA